MSTPTETPAKRAQATSPLMRRLMPIGAVTGALALIAIVYLGYDLAKGKVSPCEAIFQQTSLGLKTKISFLKTEGELQIGREQLTDLDERAQMAALNLKTCCTVLDAGRVDPEQFLQCKGSARAYESRLGDIADLVRDAVKEGVTTSSLAATATATPQPQPQAKQKIAAEIAAAQEISRKFNRNIVTVRKEQALAQLKATPPKNVKIEAQEREPNNDALTTNEIALGTWITGSVGAAKDADYFTFTTPATYRDRIRIELQNRSTTLEPKLQLFDKEKASLGEMHKTTQGADVAYNFVAPPDTKYVVRVSSYYGENVGVYLLRVFARKVYDAHEPNDDILHAKPISIGADVKAGIMDGGDADFYKITAGAKKASLRIAVANRSTTLRPQIVLFDANKTQLGDKHNATGGGDISYSFKAAPGATFYIRLGDYYGEVAGDYTLTVTEQPATDG